IRIRRAKLSGVFDAAVFGGDENSVGMIFKVNHVKQSDMGNHGTKQVRALGERRPDQEATVASAFDRQPRGSGVVVINEKLSVSQKVIEDILLVSQVSAAMPIFSVLAPPAQVGNGDNASLVQPEPARDTEARRLTDAETPVTIEQYGILSVQRGPSPVDDVKRHPRAVFGHCILADNLTV